MQTADYREFYQKALVPAGMNDRKFFLDTHPDTQDQKLHTHLLIGLQGRQLDNREYYNWKVIIYKADPYGIYDACTPIYSSELYDRFDDAVEAARTIEKDVTNDQLHTHREQEKIS
ncbi:MAG TPA: hypothetical protein DCR24_02275 [Bacillus bacterium]|nr:hypothetical protein [Bacillus sp. (in: firmicutes)]